MTARAPAGRAIHHRIEDARAPGPGLAPGGPELRNDDALHRRANQLARALQRRGLGPQDRVGVALARSPELVTAVLAILKAGAAYVPLDPGAPAPHRAFIERDAGLRLIVSEPARRADLSADLPVVDLVADAAEIAAQPDHDLAIAAPLDALAYLVYTSGTTGVPKGVMIPHGALANHAEAIAARYALGPADRVLQLAAPGFDVAAEEIFATLAAGAGLVIAPPELPASFAELARWVAARRVTVLNLPASLWRAWLDELARGAADLPASVRLVIVGSEPVGRADWARWHALVGARLHTYNAYGPTEATITATLFDGRADRDPFPDSAGVPIGRPIANVRAYVAEPDDGADGGLRLAAAGAPGLLYLGGAGLARGYHGLPGLTAARFVPDPWSGVAGARLYATGDLVRRADDGTLEFLGRADRQVKVAGHRIELEHVERALAGHPRVRAAAVVARPLAHGGVRLVGYVAADGDPPGTAELRAFLAPRLPGPAIPSVFIALAAWPTTASGKTDHAALAARPDDGDDGDDGAPSGPAPRAPRGEAERVLAEVVGEVLGLAAPIALDAAWFALGGDSLTAMRVASRIRDRLGVELSVRALFDATSLAALADQLAALPRTDDARPERLPRPPRIPLSFPQEQVWFTQQLDLASVAYTAPTVIELEGRLDLAALRAAIDELVRRHEVLRTTFPEVDGQPVQVIHPPSPVALPITDLTGLPPAARLAERQRRIAAVLAAPFRLDELPLLRWHLIRLADDHHALAVVEHHLVHDGWSTNVLFGELFELYRAFARGEPSPLPEPGLAFADFVVWHRRWLDGPEGARQLRYWTDQLAGVTAQLQLPTDHERPAARTFRGGALRAGLPPELDRALRAYCQREGVTVFVVLLAAYAVVLQRYSRQAELCIGSGIANRRWQVIERTVGMLINTIALRIDVADDPSFRALVHRLRGVTLDAAAHQDLPFTRVVEALQLPRDPSRNPLFQVMFGLHDAPLAGVELPELAWSILESPSNGSAKFDLGLIVIPRPEHAGGWTPALGADGHTLIWEFNRDLFEPATIAAIQGQYLTVLGAALAAPERAISRLPMITADERARIRAAWSAADEPYPADATIHQRLAAIAARDPAAPALADGAARWTYGELDARANQLARHLIGAGVERGDRVAVWAERSGELVIALVAILKAGAAYVPLEPSYPPARLAWLADDAGARLIVSARAIPALPTAAPLPAVVLDELRARLDAEPTAPPADRAAPDDLAYVIYTSGSTGAPKPVATPHRGVVRLASPTTLPLGPGDRFAQLATWAFDAATLELWGALLNGAELVVLPTRTAIDPGALAAAIARHAITCMFTATALLHQLIDHRPAMFAPLRQLMFGGEAADPRRIAALVAAGPPARLLHLYGPTEATVLASWHPVAQVADRAARVPIGRPHPNTTLRVLDAHLDLVPVGVPGELHVGGPGLARGYLDQPALTAERFRPDPWSDQPGARLYATGDWVRYRPDGALDFLGRVDGQLKIRGVRIEPAELELALRQHPAVHDAVVIARGDAAGERALVGYVVLRAGPPRPTAAELRDWLTGRVPPALVPDALVTLDELPLAASGKVDRAALPAPAAAPPIAPDPPVGLLEAQLAQLWAELLGARAVGRHDNFFRLGGHSLRAMRLLARVSAELEAELSIAQFFEAPTVAAMAAAITDQRAELAQALAGLSDAEAAALLGDD